MHCPICDAILVNGVCPECGYDESVDYEKYLTLQPVCGGVMSIKAKKVNAEVRPTIKQSPFFGDDDLETGDFKDRVDYVKTESSVSLYPKWIRVVSFCLVLLFLAIRIVWGADSAMAWTAFSLNDLTRVESSFFPEPVEACPLWPSRNSKEEDLEQNISDACGFWLEVLFEIVFGGALVYAGWNLLQVF